MARVPDAQPIAQVLSQLPSHSLLVWNHTFTEGGCTVVCNCIHVAVCMLQLRPYAALLQAAGESPDDSASSTPAATSAEASPAARQGPGSTGSLPSGELHQSNSLGSRRSLARTTPPSPPWQEDPPSGDVFLKPEGVLSGATLSCPVPALPRAA